MKTKALIISIFLFFSIPSLKAQEPPMGKKMRETIKQEKIEFFNHFIGFTPDEGKKFWDIYNPYEENLHKLNQDRRITMEYYNLHADDLTPDEATRAIAKMIEYDKNELQLRMALVEKLQTVLPAVKMVRFMVAQEEFRRHLLQKYKGMHGERGKRWETD